MTKLLVSGCALFLSSVASGCVAQPAMSKSGGDGVPIATLVESVADKTGKRFIVDPRVRADVNLIRQKIEDVSYDDLLTILALYGFTAVEGGGYVRLVPDAVVRQLALPIVASGSKHHDTEFVTAVFPVKNMPAAQLVPILRPLLPQIGHLAAAVCSNQLIMVDTYANVRRIEAVVKQLDTGTPYEVERCQAHEQTPGS